MNGLAIRFGLLALALVALAWLGLGLRGVRLESDADRVLAAARSGPVSQTAVDGALGDYAKAGRLSPDQTPLIRQGQLLLASGHRAEAQEVARRATTSEPDNLQAWTLAWAAADRMTPAKAHAKAELLKLNPWFLFVLTRRSPT